MTDVLLTNEEHQELLARIAALEQERDEYRRLRDVERNDRLAKYAEVERLRAAIEKALTFPWRSAGSWKAELRGAMEQESPCPKCGKYIVTESVPCHSCGFLKARALTKSEGEE